jgi:hypothetical protein
MSGELKIDREYIILAGSDVAKVKVLDVTATSIRVHNLDDDFIKRYLLEDYKPRVIEEVVKSEDTSDSFIQSVIEGAYLPTSDFGTLTSPSNHGNFVEAFTKHLEGNEGKILQTNPLSQSNAERLAEILKANSQEEVEELVKEDKEIWKEILNMGCLYWLSNKGRVKNRHNKLLKPATIRGKKYYYLIRMDKSSSTFNVDDLLKRVFGLTKIS